MSNVYRFVSFELKIKFLYVYLTKNPGRFEESLYIPNVPEFPAVDAIPQKTCDPTKYEIVSCDEQIETTKKPVKPGNSANKLCILNSFILLNIIAVKLVF